MDKLTHISGIAAVLAQPNIDTDVITPGRFITTHPRERLPEIAFYPLRFEPDGTEKQEFPLNQGRFKDAEILITGPNFGCGSSRETAVWAIKGLGIRCVIGESFGDIFFGNCFQNSVLPIVLPADEVAALMVEAESPGNQAPFEIDVATGTVTAPSGKVHRFALSESRRTALLEGLDAIGQTRRMEPEIAAFQAEDRERRPWVYEI